MKQKSKLLIVAAAVSIWIFGIFCGRYYYDNSWVQEKQFSQLVQETAHNHHVKILQKKFIGKDSIVGWFCYQKDHATYLWIECDRGDKMETTTVKLSDDEILKEKNISSIVTRTAKNSYDLTFEQKGKSRFVYHIQYEAIDACGTYFSEIKVTDLQTDALLYVSSQAQLHAVITDIKKNQIYANGQDNEEMSKETELDCNGKLCINVDKHTKYTCQNKNIQQSDLKVGDEILIFVDGGIYDTKPVSVDEILLIEKIR